MVYIGSKSYIDFIQLIKPYCVWQCYKYKHDLSEYKKQTYASGEINGHAKLTSQQVFNIIHEYKTKILNQPQLAKKYNVNQSCISRLINKKRWKQNLNEVSDA